MRKAGLPSDQNCLLVSDAVQVAYTYQGCTKWADCSALRRLSYELGRCVRKIAKNDCRLRRVCLADRPHGTARLPLTSSRDLIFEDFCKIFCENSSFSKL